MGFGLLVVGYFLLINVPFHGVDLPPDLLGYILIFTALAKLGKYQKKLLIAKYTTLPLIVLSGIKLALSLAAAFGANDFDVALDTISYISAVAQLIFYFFLLLGIKDLSEEVGLTKNARKSVRNLFIIFAFYIYTVYVNLAIQGVVPQISGAYIAFQQLLGYIVRFLNLIQFISCYMWICLEEDKDMKNKSSLTRAVDRFLKREEK